VAGLRAADARSGRRQSACHRRQRHGHCGRIHAQQAAFNHHQQVRRVATLMVTWSSSHVVSMTSHTVTWYGFRGVTGTPPSDHQQVRRVAGRRRSDGRRNSSAIFQRQPGKVIT